MGLLSHRRDLMEHPGEGWSNSPQCLVEAGGVIDALWGGWRLSKALVRGCRSGSLAPIQPARFGHYYFFFLLIFANSQGFKALNVFGLLLAARPKAEKAPSPPPRPAAWISLAACARFYSRATLLKESAIKFAGDTRSKWGKL